VPQFTITVSESVLTRLQTIVQRYNETTGQTFTVKDWILLHLKEMAIGDDLSSFLQAEQAKQPLQFQAALAAERDRLLTALQ
jgi:hypothetical protein